MHLHLDQDQR